ncbi:MAG: hypothetical protein KZQ93_20555 [Candidatus Thiodiazotropha sp. (ex Monitilora ramsayi)]|nr:hypothetical protein [Candidatus Thiodiazotropha sp. (ex Monitilora ramsayi)]
MSKLLKGVTIFALGVVFGAVVLTLFTGSAWRLLAYSELDNTKHNGQWMYEFGQLHETSTDQQLRDAIALGLTSYHASIAESWLQRVDETAARENVAQLLSQWENHLRAHPHEACSTVPPEEQLDCHYKRANVGNSDERLKKFMAAINE